MDIRNVAIIAHVDHGKTTLIDVLLRMSGLFRDNQVLEERAMDSNDLEKERGITILAKVTSLQWKDVKINIVDTPGHADFGGEVERILNMVDGAILLVDAAEGPMPQTKFVLSKALKAGIRPMVMLNKIDKPDARPEEVVNQVFDLFVALEATDEQLDFPILYGSAKQGWIADTEQKKEDNMDILLDKIIDLYPAPTVESGKFKMLVTMIESNPYLGRVLIGRIKAGSIRANEQLQAMDMEGNIVDSGKISQVLGFSGLQRLKIESAEAGDIVALTGLSKATVSHTVCDKTVTDAIMSQPIDPPTISVTFRVNDGPLAGREGTKVQSRVIRERLMKEAEGNIALKITQGAGDFYEVAGRGELQLGILIETMRREGFELLIGRPKVLFLKDENNKDLEPIEEVTIDVDEEYSGTVMNKLAERKGELMEMKPSGGNRTRLILHVPTRGLIGYQTELLTDTKGTAILNRIFHSYAPYRGVIKARTAGSLISMCDGEATAYSMFQLKDRGPMIINPGDKVYLGMIIGEHSRGSDLEVNVTKGKKLTNVRASGKDDAILLAPPLEMTLEKALSYIGEDEYVEVTPVSIRLRKIYRDANERKRFSKG